MYNKAATVEEFALDYYNSFFKEKEELAEIHAVINVLYKITASVMRNGSYLVVHYYEYVDKEEHDAKVLFGGMSLGEVWVDIETGKVYTLDQLDEMWNTDD